MPSQTVKNCSEILANRRLTIAFAESATAGRMASEFSLTENSGSILLGGLVCYDACIKESILGVEALFVERFTPESAEVTEEMARRLKNLINADITVAVTGLTTAGGSETSEKPVGTMFVHILIGDSSIAVREVFDAPPEEIVLATVDLAADTITAELKNLGK